MATQGPGIAGPPLRFRQNETVYWQDTAYTDRFDNIFDSGSYALTYVFAGPASGGPISMLPSSSRPSST